MNERTSLKIAVLRHKQLKQLYDKLAAMLLFTKQPAKVLKAFHRVKSRLDKITRRIGYVVEHYRQIARNKYENRKRAK
ncbi:MAG: hypothetical protein WC907_06165 [Acholeplasmataceae bacterium]